VGYQWTVRPVQARDEERWKVLYRGYREFYHCEPDENVVETTWQWVLNGRHNLFGLVVADADQTVFALANSRVFARPLMGQMGIYLDDLFTDPELRGQGLGGLLLTRLQEIAKEKGAGVVRWITAEDNATARVLYDKRATLTVYRTYDMKPLT